MDKDKIKSDMISVLRVISCLLVMGVHTRMYMPFTGSGGVLDIVTSKGQDGLWIFMIFSGYLIFYSYKNSKNIKEYLVKRLLRLLPAYWGWLICIMIYGFITQSYNVSAGNWFRAFTFTTLIIFKECGD